MKQFIAVLLLWLTMMIPAQAATETVAVDFLPLQEAADLARSQLSANGNVAVLPSRRLLILEDDDVHIDKARKLLQQLDRMPAQFVVYVDIESVEAANYHAREASGALGRAVELPGGWLQVRLRRYSSHAGNRQTFQLRASAGEPGSLELGQLRPVRREIRQWLSGYGLIRAESVELVPLTSGFHLQLWPVHNGDQVRVRLSPWMQRLNTGMQGRQEMLLELGSTSSPATPPAHDAPMRLNATPHVIKAEAIEIAGAATELIVATGETVTIAAAGGEAGKLGTALLAGYSDTEQREFVIRLRVEKK